MLLVLQLNDVALVYDVVVELGIDVNVFGVVDVVVGVVVVWVVGVVVGCVVVASVLFVCFVLCGRGCRCCWRWYRWCLCCRCDCYACRVVLCWS